MTQRQVKIITLLDEKGTMEVVAMARLLGVSAVTIRKDIALLEERNLLEKQHGCVARISHDEIGYRMSFAYEQKKRIAVRAAEMVQNGETVMIESGSTCIMLAIELAEKKQDITIITNSAYIAGAIRKLPGAKAMLLGGMYDTKAQLTTGPLVPICAEKFYVDKFFLGTDGFDPAQGFFSNADLLRAEAVNAMGKSAAKKIILTDSSKFNRRGVVKLFFPSELHAVVTDDIPDNCRVALEQSGMEIIIT